mgnify:CR=1 FL=1
MAEYWGAQAYYFSGPNGEGTHYVRPEPTEVDFTMPAGEDNPKTIDVIRQQIMGQHPEEIAALADQWMNAYSLMSHIKNLLFEQSDLLYQEKWTNGEARDAFMKRGPGETLAYLDEWMDSALNNVTALRSLVHIARSSREEMEDLWQEYEGAIREAAQLDWGTRFEVAWQVWRWDVDAARKEEKIEDVNNKKKEYNREAQALAWRYAEQYWDVQNKIGGGHGPLFVPMDAVMNPPHPPFPSLPGGPPPVAPPAVAPPPVPLATPPPTAPVTTPTAPPTLPLRQRILNLTQNPPAPPSGLGTQNQPTPSAVPDPDLPPALPDGLSAVSPATVPGFVPPPVPGTNQGLPTAPPATSPSTVPSALNKPLGQPSLPPAPGMGGLKKGVLQGKTGAPGLPPGMTQPPGRTLGRKPPGAGTGQEDRTLVPGPVETEDAFSRPPGSTAPPVLNNQRPNQRRPGSREELMPPARAGGPHEPGTPLQSGATPPVLNRPGSTPPQQKPTGPGRPERGRTGATRSQQPPPGSEWTGVRTARDDAGPPVLGAPTPPARGAGMSRLEEVPTQLRGRSTEAATRQAPGTVSPELAARRAVSRTGVPDGDKAEDGQKIVTDEEAFTVETPGGGVVKQKQQQNTGYRAETAHRSGRQLG